MNNKSLKIQADKTRNIIASGHAPIEIWLRSGTTGLDFDRTFNRICDADKFIKSLPNDCEVLLNYIDPYAEKKFIKTSFDNIENLSVATVIAEFHNPV